MPTTDPTNKISVPQFSLPKGGGAIKGIGETFQPNHFSGTGSFSIPIYTSPCRDFEPKISLDYHSASGNGPFGLGFSLSIPNISRKTDKRIPKYEDSDIFILANAEDLVSGAVRNDGTWTITSYSPRIEGLFAKIEYWKNATESFWKVVTKENITSIYGRNASARIADPNDSRRVFQWLIEETSDAKGNKIAYTFEAENCQNVDDEIYEQNRVYTANKYLRSIRYGNYFVTDGKEPAWAFEVVFDYGDYNLEDNYLTQPGCDPYYHPGHQWTTRLDPFSTYRSGFEIRTYRLCRNILMFHHFPTELGDKPCLTRATRLTYWETETLTQLTAVKVEGFRRKADGSYESKIMPPLEFGYSSFKPADKQFEIITVANGGTLPGHLDQSQYDLVDLYGDGLPGVLYSDNKTTLYWKPKGNGEYGSPAPPVQFPIERDLRTGEYALVSLEGNGKLDLVVGTPQRGGFYECNQDGSWEPYRSFASYPLDYVNPHKAMIDYDGNGIPEIIIFEDRAVRIYPSRQKEGYGAPTRAELIEDFPATGNEYAEEVLSFTDLFGDGLSHRVRIRNGSVECWPHLGYGRFGKKVLLGNAPRFEGKLDASRLFLADIDGSGTTDLIYVQSNQINIYLNRSGNSFSSPVSIPLPKTYTDLDQISFGDVKGNGTACLIFTQISPEVRHYYYDFAGETKPYLLQQIDNNLGALTQIEYCSSVKFYLEDQKSGKPWKTKLPFPVQVVGRVETIDQISGSKLVTTCKYHDGYYDYVEREFRGFGFVEEWDTEDFDNYNKSGLIGDTSFTAVDKDLFVPPIYTKRWYHTGAFMEAGVIAKQYQEDYYRKDTKAYLMPESSFDREIDTGDAESLRQAYRALKGQMLREEIYAVDDKPGFSELPYTVTESNFHVRQVQLKDDNEYAVFLVHGKETISYHYERNSEDPRIAHQFTLEVDPYGNVTKSCQVYYPRRLPAYPEQAQLKATAGVNLFIKTRADFWLHSIPYENQTFEIGGLELKQGQNYFSYNDVQDQVVKEALVNIIRNDDKFASGQKQARCLTWERDYYWNITQDNFLPLGQITACALLHHSEQAVFTPELIQNAFQQKLKDNILQNDGGYYLQNGYWWNRGMVKYYHQQSESRFYLPWKVENSFAASSSSLFQKTTMEYDPYCLTITCVKQYLSDSDTHEICAVIDYITMQPKQITDINDNISQVLFDPLGMVVVTSNYGTVGDKLQGDQDVKGYKTSADMTFENIVKSVGNQGTDKPNPYLQQTTAFFYYDMFAWQERRQPVCFINLIRETHSSERDLGKEGRIQLHISYSDGFGREIEKKVKVDPGDAFVRDGNSGTIKTATVADRFITSGRTVYNNKGKPVMQYQPFFSAIPGFEDQKAVESLLPQPSVVHYDPLLREIRIDTPKGRLPGTGVLGFFSQVEFSPWEEKHFDQNDTIIDSEYYQAFMKYAAGNPNLTESEKDEKDALVKAAHFYNTSQIKVLDTLGHVFLDIQDNLGAVTPETFSEAAAGTNVKPEDLWNELKGKGYLGTRKTFAGDGWVTEKFRPYASGFTLELDDKYKQFEGPLTDILRQSCLTSYHQSDISGREILSIDPRLYYTNVTKQTQYYNFTYLYDMAGKEPLNTDSADAGMVIHVSNIFGNLIWSWTPRNFNQQIYYDRLQRKALIQVKGIKDDGTVATDNTVEVFTYGETLDKAKDKNLRGQLYELKDQSGIVISSLFGLEGEVLETSRQLTAEYKQSINWSQDVPLEPEIYKTTFNYDALKRMISETTPDGTLTASTFNTAGLLDTVSAHYNDGSVQNVINHIEYDATGLRLAISYTNGTKTFYTYEETTKNLINLQSIRPGKDSQGNNWNTLLQAISYTYDPAGNITRIRDNSIQTVFNNNQKVEPLSDYTYDALYRLTRANGRQHPGINAASYVNNLKAGDFKQSKFASLNDGEKLENYSERYGYDEAGNLIETIHTAANAWTRRVEIQPGSNRLNTIPNKDGNPGTQQIGYDRSGNQSQLYLNSAVDLTWNCCENLVRAGIIQRPDEEDDCDYYTYDSKELRTRKISKRMTGGGIVRKEEKIYLGNYEIKRIKATDADSEKTVLERQTLRIMDGQTCVAIIHYWKQDDQKREADQPGTRKHRYQMGNHLGSVSLELDKDAGLISYEEYFPYGGTAIIAGDNQKEVELKEYRYSGKECDDSTGLYYYGTRYYAPWLGRWLKPDPAGTVDGLNLYLFVRGNPMTFHDPDGSTIYRQVSDRNRGLLQDAQNAINFARSQVPYAGNVYADVVTTYAESSARLGVERSIFSATFGDVESRGPSDAINRAASAIQAHGGACNEFSALTHTYLISQQTTEPVIRVWDNAAHHSFTMIGDPRQRSERDVIVADAWPSSPQAATLEDTRWNHILGPGRLDISTVTPLVSVQGAQNNWSNLIDAFYQVPVGLPPYSSIQSTLGNTSGRDDHRGPRGIATGEDYNQYFNRTLTWTGLFNNNYSTTNESTHSYYHDEWNNLGNPSLTYVTRTYHTGRVEYW